METWEHPLKRIRALGLLNDEELSTFRRLLRVERFSPRTELIRQGEVEDNTYFLVRGHVNVTRETPEGEVFLTMLGPGEYFGEAALFQSQVRTAHVRSVREVEVYSLARSDFLRCMEENPGVAARILFGMFQEHVERLQKTSKELLGRHTVATRFSLNALCT